MWSRLHSAVKVGLVVAILAFFVKLEVSSTVTRNGVVASCSYVNYLAILAGLFCIGAGILALRLGTKSNLPQLLVMAKQSHLVLGPILLVFGVIHLLAGAGLILGPC